MWLSYNRFDSDVRQFWSSLTITTSDLGGKLIMKLRALRSFIKSWSRQNFTHVITSKRQLLSSIHLSNPLVIFDLLHSWSKFISHLSMQLEHIQTAKETMWAQKARTWWLKGGDKNTKFYHHSPNRRRSKNFIPFLEVNRVELSNQDAISNAFSNFFCNLMGTTAPSHDIDVNWEQYYPVTSRPHLLDLEEPFMEEEIRATMFSLGADKAPVQMALILDSISTFGRFFDKTSSTSFRLYMMEISILPNWTELT